MIPKIKTYLPLILVLVFVLVPLLAGAQESGGGLVGCRDNCTLGDLVLVIIRIVNLLLSLASMVAMVFIVWAGWNMIFAGGNEEEISKAKTTFSNAIIGFFLVMAAYILIDAITVILGGFTIKQLFDFIPKS